MMDPETNNLTHADVVAHAVGVVTTALHAGRAQAHEIPALIRSTFDAIKGLAAPASGAAPAVEQPSPALIRRSITPDALVSFIDGKPYKTLKRHLTGHGLDPATYRARYGLPADYPMVCPNYSAQRSALAKNLGLGQPGGPKALRAVA